MLWSFVALVLTPLGLLANALLLSGWWRAEEAGSRICSLSILVGNVSLQVDKICVLFAALLFGREAWRSQAGEEASEAAMMMSASMQDRSKMTRWRHERNYWISLYVLTLWAVAWRVNYLVKQRRPAAPLTGEPTLKTKSS